ncbi:hypothetical protein [Streptosporangium saharense]|uniref:hypothetical protein n=1 Tax=Streptosporangium saharense TaxID=1706840 RepID=UPI003333238F
MTAVVAALIGLAVTAASTAVVTALHRRPPYVPYLAAAVAIAAAVLGGTLAALTLTPAAEPEQAPHTVLEAQA